MADYGTSIFLFRRDLRISDNTGLIEASQASKTVVPLFIFDPRQGWRNPYFSPNAFQFMIESLEDLAHQVTVARGRLSIFRGRPETIVDRLVAEEDIEAVFINKDYTPFSRTRDAAIAKACQNKDAAFRCCSDTLLHKPTDVLKDDGKPYTIFSHFLRKARSVPVRPINVAEVGNLSNVRVASEQREILDDALKPANQRTYMRGGRPQALEVLATLHQFVDYATARDYPAKNATTRLSAHHKFGTCSIRETYQAIATQLGLEHRLIVELFWRDFYSHIAYFFPTSSAARFIRSITL